MALQPLNVLNFVHCVIYNSRNYYGIIASLYMAGASYYLQQQKLLWHYSHTVVRNGKNGNLQQQKLLWHYSPFHIPMQFTSYLQQQKLLWHYSRRKPCRHQSFDLQQQKLLWHYSPSSSSASLNTSTIVEIIMALQPRCEDIRQDSRIYNSRNYYGIIIIAENISGFS